MTGKEKRLVSFVADRMVGIARSVEDGTLATDASVDLANRMLAEAHGIVCERHGIEPARRDALWAIAWRAGQQRYLRGEVLP